MKVRHRSQVVTSSHHTIPIHFTLVWVALSPKKQLLAWTVKLLHLQSHPLLVIAVLSAMFIPLLP